MKTLKLVLGIFSLIFSIIVLIQSCAAGVVNTLLPTGDAGGTAGLLVALFFIAGGIVMIATRNSESKGGSITCIILYIIAAIIGFTNAAIYQDLIVWSVFSLILAVISIISLFVKKKEPTAVSSESVQKSAQETISETISEENVEQ